MKYKMFASLAVASALGILLPFQTHAFGLGKLELSSALNEPFKGEISVTALQANELEALEVRLASNQDFDKAGLERTFLLTQLQFEVIERQGQARILITSKQAVKEPFLDFLVTATTGEGRLIREYTVLLDPPKNVFAKPASKTTPSAKAKQTSTKTTTTATKTYDRSPKISGNTYGPTGRTDTLWDIALKTRPQSSLSVHQMMMALLAENPEAFVHDNINGLKAGYTLQIPSIEDIKRLSKTQAVNATSEQNTLWKNRNKKSVTTNDNVEPQVIAQPSTSQDQAIAEVSAIEADVSPLETEDEVAARLKLVVPSDASVTNDGDLSLLGSDSEKIRVLNEQLTLAQETIEGQSQENIDFKARMDSMEEQLETMRRLISLKDADLARLQSLLGQDQAVDSQELVDEDIALVEQADEADSGLTDENLGYAVGGEVITEQQAEDQQSSMPTEDVVDTVSEIEQVSAETDQIDSTTEDESFGINTVEKAFDNVMDKVDLSAIPSVDEIVASTTEFMNIDTAEVNDVIAKVKKFVAEHRMESMLGGLIILILLWLIVRRINRPDVSWDEAVEKLDNTPPPQPVVKEPSTQLVDEDDDTASSQNEVLVELEPAKSKSVDDFISQADMFVGYADYIQARSSLEQAKQLEPDNEKVNLKLLYVLFKQKQAEPFVRLASTLNIDKDSADWADVVGWGQSIAPEHELFSANQQQVDDIQQMDSPTADFEHVVDDVLESAEETSDAIAEDELSTDLEFNLDAFNVDTTDSDREQQDDSDDELLSFNTGFNVEDSVEADEQSIELDLPVTLDLDTSKDEELISLDLSDTDSDDISLELGGLDSISDDELKAAAKELTGQTDEAPQIEQELTGSDMEFDIGNFDEIDEAETKLDLAAAYIDMGDPEGAKNILDEVVRDGNDDQKNRAQALLDDLA